MSGVKETVDAFDRENGNQCVVIGNWLYFLSGGKREVNPMGLLVMPPTNDFERLSNIKKYHEEKLRRARVKFDKEKERLLSDAHANRQNGYGAPCEIEHAEQILTALAKDVRVRERCLRTTLQKLASTPEGARRRVSDEIRADCQQENSRFISTVKSIKV